MPLEIYEIVAGAARYWFLFLMVLIVFRSFRWYRKDQKQQKKQLKLMPDAGYIGEMVVVKGQDGLEAGTTLPVSWEGVLGYTRFSDICVPVDGVAKKHCWFRYLEGEGLEMEPFRGRSVEVDGVLLEGPKENAVMGHGSWLQIGDIVMRLRMFSGYETKAPQPYGGEIPQQERNAQAMPFSPAMPQPQYPPQLSPEQYALWQQQIAAEQRRQMLEQQQQEWLQWTERQRQQMQPRQYPQPQPIPPQPIQPQQMPPRQYPQPQQPPVHPDAPFMRPASEKPAAPAQENGYRPSAQIEYEHNAPFYPLEMDDEGEEVLPEDAYEPYQPYDEDMTDAALPPRSDYVGEDESRRARQVLDKYLGGGGAE